MQYYRDEPVLTDAGVTTDFTDNDNSDSFNLKQTLIGETSDDSTKHVEIMVPLKYQSKFWRTY